jgi:hypothetical protein
MNSAYGASSTAPQVYSDSGAYDVWDWPNSAAAQSYVLQMANPASGTANISIPLASGYDQSMRVQEIMA